MDLKQLEYFVAVCDKGSFTQAAESLYTSQPNVSKAVLSLEKELGQKLVERSSKGLTITSYGRAVREYAVDILKHASMLRQLVQAPQSKKFSACTLHCIEALNFEHNTQKKEGIAINGIPSFLRLILKNQY